MGLKDRLIQEDPSKLVEMFPHHWATRIKSGVRCFPGVSRMQWSHMYLRIKFPSLDQIVSRAAWSESEVVDESICEKWVEMKEE